MEALERDVWAFVASLAQTAAPSELAVDPEVELGVIRQRAHELLSARSRLGVTVDGQLSTPLPRDATAVSGSAAPKSDTQIYEAVNEQIARRMIDGVEPLGEARAAEADDKSDTLSDCTTITETSSVYGIHNTWVDLAVLYSLPFVFDAADMSAPNSGSRLAGRRLKAVPALNIGQEQLHLNKIFQECQRAIHTMRAVATVDSLRKVLDRGVTVLHFSGHGGRLVGKKNYLVFEDTQCAGLAHLVDAGMLRNILSGSGSSGVTGQNDTPRTTSFTRENEEDQDAASAGDSPPSRSPSIVSASSVDGRSNSGSTLKLVFVSSCDSKEIGEVFVQAGVAHVVCVQCEANILDEASSLFSYSFYHAALTGKSVHQAFEIARVRVSVEMHIPERESEKFVLLESSLLHADECPLYSSDGDTPRAIEVNFTEKICSCNAQGVHSVFSDISVGKWIDVSPPNRYNKTLPAVSESFVGRELELHTLAELVNHHRFVTIRGPPGIGKSTLSIRLAHFLAERNVFPDGVAFIRLRDVQSLEGMESAIKSSLFPDGGKEKEIPLYQALADVKALLVLDNMEDPINASPSAVRELMLHILQSTPHVSFLMTARQAMGGGISDFDEKVISLNRLSHFHAADLFLKKSPRPLLVSEIGDVGTDEKTGKTSSMSILDALMNHPLMAFLDGHPQAISLCAPLLQDRSLSELTRAVLNRGVSELQVVGLPAHDRSAVNTLVTSLGVSLEQVRTHHGPDAIRFFALLGLLPAGAMPVDFKSLWGNKWEVLVETLLRFSLIQRNRIPGFALVNRGLPKKSGVTGTTNGTTGTMRKRSSRNLRQAAAHGIDQPLLLALKSYGDYITGTKPTGSAKTDNSEMDVSTGRDDTPRVQSDRGILNTLTRSGRASRMAAHVEQMDIQAEMMAVSISYSTFPFITSYARSLLGMYDGDGAKNDVLEAICAPDRDFFLYNCAKHFWKVSFWIFKHICTLAVKSSAAYLILDMHESNLWMILDLHVRMIEEWRAEADLASSSASHGSEGGDTAVQLQKKIGGYVVDVACFFAHSLFLSGRHRGAWNAANKSLHIAKHHKHTISEANTRKLMGILLTTETKFDEAKAQFGMALILYKAVGDKIGQAASLSAIGMIHSRKGNLRGAHNCFTKALTLYEWFKHSLGQLNCHQRLANLEKKLRDGDGMPRKSGVSTGYSHHYAATRRLQGDLNRKRNGEYIVRWVGHEMSLLLELPVSSVEKMNEAHGSQAVSPPSTLSSLSSPEAVVAVSAPLQTESASSVRSPTSGVTNTPKKCRLGMMIEQKEHERTSVGQASTPSVIPAPASASSSSVAASANDSVSDRLKNSSFAKRKEYDSNIRRVAAAATSATAGITGTSPPEA